VDADIILIEIDVRSRQFRSAWNNESHFRPWVSEVIGIAAVNSVSSNVVVYPS